MRIEIMRSICEARTGRKLRGEVGKTNRGQWRRVWAKELDTGL